jgi:hypothetical protein
LSVRGIHWIDVADDKEQVAGTCVCGNEPLGSIKCREFLDYLRSSSWKRALFYGESYLCSFFCCHYVLIVVNVPFLLPVCPPSCQCTNIVANMPLLVSISFLLPECPPGVSLSFLLPVYPPCCQFIVTIASMPFLLSVYYSCYQYALLVAV